MRLIADRIIAMPKTRDPDLDRARDMLRLPAPNHAGTILDRDRPMVDRYVFNEAAIDAIIALLNTKKARIDAIRTARPPCVPCWVEAPSWGMGWLIETDGEGSKITGFGLLHRVLNQHHIFPHYYFSFDFNNDGANEALLIRTSPLLGKTIQITAGGVAEEDYDSEAISMPLYLCAVLTSSRFAIARRVLTRDTGEARLLRRRKALGRVPFFSYNYVTLPVPGDPCFRGEVLPGDGTGSHQRRHWRHGYWRLQDARAVDGELIPFWIWVEGYEAGNEDLGHIVKERHVTVDGAGVIDGHVFRRGYRMPDFEGRKGQRIKATKETAS